MPFLEVACFNSKSAILAQAGGASRVELCIDREVGGRTPNYATLAEVKAAISIPVYMMIRPRGGDFVYSDKDFEGMKHAIQLFWPYVDGFVFGTLDCETGIATVNIHQNTVLVELAKGKPCTFHKAFDQINDLDQALEDAIACGFKTILTSAGESTAVMGMQKLKSLTMRAKGRIVIMPGGDVRSSNLKTLKDVTGAEWFHSACITDDGELANVREVVRLADLLHANGRPLMS